MEMAVDVLNLFLIKEKAPACVRDELLERKPGRSQRGSGAARWGNVRTSPAARHRPSRWVGTLAFAPSHHLFPGPDDSPYSPLSLSASGKASWGLSYRGGEQCGGLGSDSSAVVMGKWPLLLALRLLISKRDTRGSL